MFAFIHGAGDVGWYWHLVRAELESSGHDTVAPDLPVEDDSAGLSRYADVVVDAVGGRRDVVVVAQSFGGYAGPDRRGTDRCTIDRSRRRDGASARRVGGGDVREHGLATGAARGLEHTVCLLPRCPTGDRGSGAHPRTTSIRHARQRTLAPACLAGDPDSILLCRNDRFFPARWLRPLVRDRLRIDPDEIESGHCPALSRPRELASLLERYVAEL